MYKEFLFSFAFLMVRSFSLFFRIIINYFNLFLIILNKHINHFPCHICPFYADSFLGGFIVLIRLYFLCHSGPCFGSGQQLGGGWMVDKTGYDIKCGLINATGYTIIINGSSTTEPSLRLKPIPTKFKNIFAVDLIYVLKSD